MAQPPRHLLVVDDEPHIGLLLQPRFEQYGYRLSVARTLAEARSALESGAPPIDGMLLDLHLPDGSGVELLEELRRAPATRALPVLVLTAEGDEAVLRAAHRLGADVVTKPFSPTKLTDRVREMLGDPRESES